MIMKAAVAKAFGKPLEIEQVPVPDVGPGQVLVKIAAIGVCHTDLHAVEEDWPVKLVPPLFQAMKVSDRSSKLERVSPI